MLVFVILILIVSGSTLIGFVLSEQQSTVYINSDLDLGPHEPYAYESTYAQDMGLEEWFGVRSFEIIPDALGHPQIVVTSPGEFTPHVHLVEPKQDFIQTLIIVIVIALLVSVVAVYSRDISKLIKKE